MREIELTDNQAGAAQWLTSDQLLLSYSGTIDNPDVRALTIAAQRDEIVLITGVHGSIRGRVIAHFMGSRMDFEVLRME